MSDSEKVIASLFDSNLPIRYLYIREDSSTQETISEILLSPSTEKYQLMMKVLRNIKYEPYIITSGSLCDPSLLKANGPIPKMTYSISHVVQDQNNQKLTLVLMPSGYLRIVKSAGINNVVVCNVDLFSLFALLR